MDTAPVTASVIPDAKPAVESTRSLRPHTFGLTKTCCVCSKAQAHWSVQHPRYGREAEDICALCFLYESGWLVRERQPRVDQVVKVIGLKRGTPLECVLGEHGDKSWPPRLAKVEDADSVLGAITLHDRFEVLSSRRRAS